MSESSDLLKAVSEMSDRDLAREIGNREEDLELLRAVWQYRKRREPASASTPQTLTLGRAVEHNQARPLRRPQSRRQTILAVMREAPDRAWAYQEFREELVRRGLLEDTEQANHALSVAMSKMVKLRQLERPERGYYQLARGKTNPFVSNESAEP